MKKTTGRGAALKKSDGLRATGGVLLLLLLGKGLSFAANQAYLSYFGAQNAQLNIFSWAIQVPNYLFQAVGTALVSVAVPVYASLQTQKSTGEAGRFASDLLTACAALTAILCAAGLAVSGLLPQLTGFADQNYAALCLRIVMPTLLCYGIVYILQGVLQTNGRYRTAAAVNLPAGALTLAYLALGAERFGVTGLAVTAAAAAALQIGMLALPAHRLGLRWRPARFWENAALRAAARRSLPVLFGALAYQLNLFCNHTLLSKLAPTAVSLSQFVQAVVVGAVGVLTAAVNSVAFPELSKLAAQDETALFRRRLRGSLALVGGVLLAAAAAMAALGLPVLRLLARYGQWTAQDVATEYAFLLATAPCAVFLGLKELADRALFALHETRPSAWANALILCVNFPLAWIFGRISPLAVPLSWSAAVAAGTVFLLLRLRKRLKGGAA